ncbi:MAG: hypothetical protein JSW11_11570 [Candidatus Heimdallarchaeota archaeon]|nr:MAG: hypothetical protein JSW11_11570 [Candidatus Heimdallarchaeota archaeon]
MPKIVVVDDEGDEFSEFTVPIPFYIRLILEDGSKRYKVRLIDDLGNVRGQYLGTSEHHYVELHVPLIKLSKVPGNLRILAEESRDGINYSQKHQISIKYLTYVEESSEE